MSLNGTSQSVNNYMIPAGGLTHAVNFQGIFTATPQTIDWRQYKIDNFPFQPQGVFVDNTQGTGSLSITIQPIDYTITCAAGVSTQAQFPAPNGQTCSIVGSGQAQLIFVDFPVLPSSGVVNIANTVSVDLAAVTAGVVVPVSLPTTVSGLPYQTQEVPLSASAFHADITGAAVSATITPTANTNLRKLKLAISDNATLAVAGTDLITVTLNAVVIFKQNLYIPAVAVNGLSYADIELEFEKIAFNAGATGTLVVSIATALATGFLDINAYFD